MNHLYGFIDISRPNIARRWKIQQRQTVETTVGPLFRSKQKPKYRPYILYCCVMIFSDKKHGALPICYKSSFQPGKSLLGFVILGVSLLATSAAPYTIDLTAFTAGAGARFTELGNTNSIAGINVAMIGDHNGDGFSDYIISSSEKDSIAVVVMKKNTSNVDLKITNIVSNEFFRVIKGPANSKFGSSLSGIGDINGDGLSDIIIGCSNGEVTGRSTAGFAVVLFGTAGPFKDLVLTSSTTIITTTGFRILGPASGASFVALPLNARGLGDVNGDGVDDFAVSANSYAGTTTMSSAGVVWVIYGPKSGTIDSRPANFGNTAGVYYTGSSPEDFLGYAVAPAGDFNGDGISDFLMCASGGDAPVRNGEGRSAAGYVYLIYGSTSLATTNMFDFKTGSKGVRFLGPSAVASLGYAMSGVGDVNDDGLDDIAIGAPNGDLPDRRDCGIVYVIFGNTGVYTADVDLAVFVASSKGFAIYGNAVSSALATVARAGDLDGDGINDILVGGKHPSNKVHIVYGQREVRAAHVDTATDRVMTIVGVRLAQGLDGGKDVNGDGFPDILFGGNSETPSPFYSTGAVWMVPGPFILPTDSPTLLPTIIPTAPPSMAPTAAPSNPTADPTEMPSAAPSAPPSTAPSAIPTVAPSLDPSIAPTVHPSVPPSVAPSAPTEAPSLVPSVAPSAIPTLAPTVLPSLSPTESPTASPFLMPTAAPSVVPSARPTDAALQNFKLSVNVVQNVGSMTQAEYEAQQAAYNLTIQHTVADATEGVVPEYVTDISVQDSTGSKAIADVAAMASAASSARLKYTITVFDPVLTVETVRTRLIQATQEGKMDAGLRFYATQFGATGLSNGTFALPQVTSAAVQRDASSQLTGVQIALVVIGVMVGLGLLLMLVVIPLYFKQLNRPASNHSNDAPLDMVM